jgi:hypothetical protein
MNNTKFFNCAEFIMLEEFVLRVEKESSNTENKWNNILTNFGSWENSPVGMNSALLSHKMYFLELLFKEFPMLLKRENESIVNIAFPNTLVVGQELTVGRIVRRELTNRGGLLLTIEKSDGTLFSHEFID